MITVPRFSQPQPDLDGGDLGAGMEISKCVVSSPMATRMSLPRASADSGSQCTTVPELAGTPVPGEAMTKEDIMDKTNPVASSADSPLTADDGRRDVVLHEHDGSKADSSQPKRTDDLEESSCAEWLSDGAITKNK